MIKYPIIDSSSNDQAIFGTLSYSKSGGRPVQLVSSGSAFQVISTDFSSFKFSLGRPDFSKVTLLMSFRFNEMPRRGQENSMAVGFGICWLGGKHNGIMHSKDEPAVLLPNAATGSW